MSREGQIELIEKNALPVITLMTFIRILDTKSAFAYLERTTAEGFWDTILKNHTVITPGGGGNQVFTFSNKAIIAFVMETLPFVNEDLLKFFLNAFMPKDAIATTTLFLSALSPIETAQKYNLLFSAVQKKILEKVLKRQIIQIIFECFHKEKKAAQENIIPLLNDYNDLLNHSSFTPYLTPIKTHQTESNFSNRSKKKEATKQQKETTLIPLQKLKIDYQHAARTDNLQSIGVVMDVFEEILHKIRNNENFVLSKLQSTEQQLIDAMLEKPDHFSKSSNLLELSAFIGRSHLTSLLSVYLLDKNRDYVIKQSPQVLHFSALKKDIRLIKYFLSLNMDPKANSKKGLTSILCALSNKNCSNDTLILILNILIDAGANPNQPTPTNLYPIFIAIQDHNAKITEALLRRGASPNVFYRHRNNHALISPADIASRKNDEGKTLRLLLKYGGTFRNGPTDLILLRGVSLPLHLNVNDLIDSFEKTMISHIPLTDPENYPPSISEGLKLSKEYGDIMCEHEITDKKKSRLHEIIKNPRFLSNYYFSDLPIPPLHQAVMHPTVNIVKELCSHPHINLDFRLEEIKQKNLTPFKYYTVLHHAAYFGMVEKLKCFIEHGADLNVTTAEGYSALHLAVFSGELRCAKCLLAAGIDCTIKDKQGRTALKLAIHLAHSEMTALLFSFITPQNKDRPNSNFLTHYKNYKNDFNQKLHVACYSQKTSTILKLLETNSEHFDIDSPNEKGNTSLHYACQLKENSPLNIGRYYEIVLVLLGLGADPNRENKTQKTPLNLYFEGHPISDSDEHKKLYKQTTELFLDDSADHYFKTTECCQYYAITYHPASGKPTFFKTKSEYDNSKPMSDTSNSTYTRFRHR